MEPERLRFDFSHPQPLTGSQLQAVEDRVNASILADTPVQAEVMSRREADERGALSLFGEKYGEQVRVLSMGGGFSVELCGGTHVGRTGELGLFVIIAETGVAAGVRRVEALAARAALDWLREQRAGVEGLGRLLACDPEQLGPRIERLLEEQRQLKRQLRQAQTQVAQGGLSSRFVEVGEVKVVAERLEEVDAPALRAMVDRLKQSLGSAVVMLASGGGEDKVILMAGVTKDLSRRLSARSLMAEVAGRIGGSGGGRDDFAQGGGGDADRLPEALEAVPEWVRSGLDAKPVSS